MKKCVKIIIAFVLTALISAGGFVILKSSQGISYDISSVDKLESDIEIVSESEDGVTIKKKSDSEFKVLMFTDTHLKGDKELDKMTVSYMVKNIREQNPDLVILGGDNVTYGFNKKETFSLQNFLKISVFIGQPCSVITRVTDSFLMAEGML